MQSTDPLDLADPAKEDPVDHPLDPAKETSTPSTATSDVTTPSSNNTITETVHSSTTPDGTTVGALQHDVHTMLATLVAEYEVDDVRAVFLDRVPTFVHRTIRGLHERRANQEQIAAVVQKLCAEHCAGRYMYNPDLNGYYHLINGRRLRLIPSDSILARLRDKIPPAMFEHRFPIMRAVHAALRHEHQLLQWDPSPACVERITARVATLFHSLAEARYFMTIVGVLATRREDLLFPAAGGSAGGGGGGTTTADGGAGTR